MSPLSLQLRHSYALQLGHDCQWPAIWAGGGEVLDTQFHGANALKSRINPTQVPIERKESIRWLENMHQSSQLLGKPTRCVHIGDRESDFYELFSLAREQATRFLVRSCVVRLPRDGQTTYVCADGAAGRGDQAVARASAGEGLSLPGGGCRYEKVRRGGAVVSQGVLIVVGIGEDGYREVLGAWIADSESEASWGVVFGELKQRGLRGVRYVVSDDHAGMLRAIGRHFQGVVWQRCQVHFLRNALSLCGAQQRGPVVRLLKAVTESPARAAMRQAIAELERKAAKVVRLSEEHGEETLGVYALPEEYRRRMKSTNMLKRQNQELKRRTRLVRVFPNEQSCLRLVCGMLMETNQEWLERLYRRMDTGQPLIEETAAPDIA